MNADDGWQPQIERLGRVLSERPRLASRVLQQIEEQCELVRDHSRTRDGLRPSRSMFRWAAAGLSSIATGLVVAFVILGGSETLAFAQVQAALREIKTAIMESQYPDNPNVNHRVLVSSGHDLFRKETKNGIVIIQTRDGKTLTLNTKLRIAQMTPGAGFGLEGEELSPRDLLLSLQNVQKNAVKSLGKKSFDGRELVGFELPSGYQSRRSIWVDPESHLPVREEVTPLEPNEPPGAKRTIISVRMPRSVVTYQFNVELSDALFSLDLPDGYKLVDSADFQMPGMELPNRPADFNASNYVITPGQGIGAVRFGMTKQQVIAVLGNPESAEQFGGFTPEQQKAMDEMERKAKEDWDVYRVNREMNRIVRSVNSFVRAGEGLFYRTLGISVRVHDDIGVQGFTCSYKTSVFQMFGGRTDRGITLNSTLADVKRVYGEPTATFEPKGSVIVTFKELGLDFTFGDDGKMKEIGVNRTKTQ